MFRNFLVKMVPLKNGMNLRGNTTYMKVHRLIATNLVIHDHHLIKG